MKTGFFVLYGGGKVQAGGGRITFVTWRGGKNGSDRRRITLMAFLWNRAWRADRMPMWKKKMIKSNQHVAEHYLGPLPSRAAFAPGCRRSPRPHTWLAAAPCRDLWPRRLRLWPHSDCSLYYLGISDVRIKSTHPTHQTHFQNAPVHRLIDKAR